MPSLFLTTFLSCSQAFSLINKLQEVLGLTNQQKIEIIVEFKKVVPSCPIIIQEKKNAIK